MYLCDKLWKKGMPYTEKVPWTLLGERETGFYWKAICIYKSLVTPVFPGVIPAQSVRAKTITAAWNGREKDVYMRSYLEERGLDEDIQLVGEKQHF